MRTHMNVCTYVFAHMRVRARAHTQLVVALRLTLGELVLLVQLQRLQKALYRILILVHLHVSLRHAEVDARQALAVLLLLERLQQLVEEVQNL